MKTLYYAQKHRTVCAHLQHVGEIHGDAFHQHAVGLQLGALLAGDVAVALADQDSHLVHGGASIHVVTQSLVDGRLPVVEAGRHEEPIVNLNKGLLFYKTHAFEGPLCILRQISGG